MLLRAPLLVVEPAIGRTLTLTVVISGVGAVVGEVGALVAAAVGPSVLPASTVGHEPPVTHDHERWEMCTSYDMPGVWKS